MQEEASKLAIMAMQETVEAGGKIEIMGAQVWSDERIEQFAHKQAFIYAGRAKNAEMCMKAMRDEYEGYLQSYIGIVKSQEGKIETLLAILNAQNK